MKPDYIVKQHVIIHGQVRAFAPGLIRYINEQRVQKNMEPLPLLTAEEALHFQRQQSLDESEDDRTANVSVLWGVLFLIAVLGLIIATAYLWEALS